MLYYHLNGTNTLKKKKKKVGKKKMLEELVYSDRVNMDIQVYHMLEWIVESVCCFFFFYFSSLQMLQKDAINKYTFGSIQINFIPE